MSARAWPRLRGAQVALQGWAHRPEGDTRPASPLLKIAPAGGPTRGGVGVDEARGIATLGSGQKRAAESPGVTSPEGASFQVLGKGE